MSALKAEPSFCQQLLLFLINRKFSVIYCKIIFLWASKELPGELLGELHGNFRQLWSDLGASSGKTWGNPAVTSGLLTMCLWYLVKS